MEFNVKPLKIGKTETEAETEKSVSQLVAPKPVASIVQRKPSPPLPVTGVATPLTVEEYEGWGKAASQRATGIADKVTSGARASDMGELGKSMNQLIEVAHQYDPSKWNKGILGIFHRLTAKEIDSHFRSVNGNVDTLVAICNNEITKFRQRNVDLAKMYEENNHTYDELGNAAAEASARIAEVKANPPVFDANDPRAAEKKAALDTAITWAEKKVDDIHRHQMLCQITGPQIEQLRDNGQLLVQDFDRAISLTIPALKQQYAMYVMQVEQKQGVDLSNKIDATFEAALKKNATTLHANAVEINTSMARSAISVDTLTTVTNELVATLNDVQKIRSDMSARIATETPQIEALSKQLSQQQLKGN